MAFSARRVGGRGEAAVRDSTSAAGAADVRRKKIFDALRRRGDAFYDAGEQQLLAQTANTTTLSLVAGNARV